MQPQTHVHAHKCTRVCTSECRWDEIQKSLNSFLVRWRWKSPRVIPLSQPHTESPLLGPVCLCGKEEKQLYSITVDMRHVTSSLSLQAAVKWLWMNFQNKNGNTWLGPDYHLVELFLPRCTWAYPEFDLCLCWEHGRSDRRAPLQFTFWVCDSVCVRERAENVLQLEGLPWILWAWPSHPLEGRGCSAPP